MPVEPRLPSEQSQASDNTIDNNLFAILQMHPYEYLTAVNTIFSQCNKSSSKSYSEVSKIKLPWKNFNLMKIPKYFEEMYAETKKYSEKKQSFEEEKMDEGEKKFWRDYEELVEKFAEKKLEEKRKKQESRMEYYDKKRPKTGKQNRTGYGNSQKNMFLKRIIEKSSNISYDREQLKEEVILKLKNLNEQSNTTKIIKQPCQKFLHPQVKSAPKTKSAKVSIIKNSHIKINTPTNDQMSKISTVKHATFASNITIGKEKPSKMPKTVSESAFKKKVRNSVRYTDSDNEGPSVLENIDEKDTNLVLETDYLEYKSTGQILNTYKECIKKVDCSISSLNVQKTISLLQNLQKIANQLP